MSDRYIEKTRDGETSRELDCPEGYRAHDGKCVKMTAKEIRHREDAAHRAKRSNGNKQVYIDKKRNDTIEKNEDVNMNDKLRQLIREEIKSILNEDLEDDLEKALKQHDWFYNYSDDGRAYKKGQAQRDNIRNLMSKMDDTEAKKLWNKYAPKQYKYPENGLA